MSGLERVYVCVFCAGGGIKESEPSSSTGRNQSMAPTTEKSTSGRRQRDLKAAKESVKRLKQLFVGRGKRGGWQLEASYLVQ